jgi:hypothetical protein
MKKNHNLVVRLLSLTNVWHVFKAMQCMVLICYGSDLKAPGLTRRRARATYLLWSRTGVFYRDLGRYLGYINRKITAGNQIWIELFQ